MGLSHYNLKVYCDGMAVEYPVFDKSHKRGTGDYDRKNKISEIGYVLNNAAKKKIKNVLYYRFYKSNKNKFNRLKFWTFTVQKSFYKAHEPMVVRDKDGNEKTITAEQVADKYYIQKLSMFLENLTKNYDCRGYVWVAEKTDEGVIHFHAILDAGFLKATDLSHKWANMCGFIDFGNSVHFGFEKKGKHKVTNIKSAKQITNYLVEYVTKNDAVIYGRCYGMNAFFSDTFEKCYKTFEGGVIRGTTDRQYDILQLAKRLEPVVVLDDGISKPIMVYLSILELDVTQEYFFPELWKPEREHERRRYGLQTEVFA